jgi:hypothetical protein
MEASLASPGRMKESPLSLRKCDSLFLNSVIPESSLFRAPPHCSHDTNPNQHFSGSVTHLHIAPCLLQHHHLHSLLVGPVQGPTCSSTSGTPLHAFTHCHPCLLLIGEDWTFHQYFNSCSGWSDTVTHPLLPLV